MSNENEGRPVEDLSEPWQENVEDHLVKAIISACLCCLPFGIMAIVYSTRVKQALKAGDFNAAREESGKANFWGNLSIITGIGVIITIFVSQSLTEFTGVKVEMAQAVLAVESFESAHSSQIKKSGGLNFTMNDLLDVNESSLIGAIIGGQEYFTFTILTNEQGNPVGLRATSKVILGQFDGSLITKYDEKNDGTYNRSVEPDDMQKIAGKLIPQFFRQQNKVKR
jgi:hypothetical protein